MMAYIEGYPGREDQLRTRRHMGFIALAVVTVTGLTVWSQLEGGHGQTVEWAVVGGIALLVLMVSAKLNARGWKQLLFPRTYEQQLVVERAISDRLSELDDTYFVIHDFAFELFHVDHVVISNRGIFVIRSIASKHRLKVRNKTLFAGRDSLETLTGAVWRVCHLLNIIISKGFQLKVMPQPILVHDGEGAPDVKRFDGIEIVSIHQLNTAITSQKESSLEDRQAASIATYLVQRYKKARQ